MRIVLGVTLLWASEVHVGFIASHFWGPVVAIGEFAMGAALLMAGPDARGRVSAEVEEAQP